MNTDRMTCGAAREKLLLYVGGDLDGETLEAVGAHLERCTECSRRAEAGKRARRGLVAALRERPEAARPGSLWPGIRTTLLAEGLIREPSRPIALPSAAARPRRSRWTLALAPLAAAAALLLVTEWSGAFHSGPGDRILPNPARPIADAGKRPADVEPVAFTEPAPRPTTGGLRRLGPDEVQPLRPFAPQQGLRTGDGDVSLAGYNRRVR